MHSFFSGKKLISLFFLVFFLFFLGKNTGHAEAFENENFSLSHAGGYFYEPITVTLTPKTSETLFWSFFTNTPSNFNPIEKTSEIIIPRNRNFYVFTENSPIERFSFKIENKSIENKFFRIEEIDSNPAQGFMPTLTVKNNSGIHFSLSGWRIEGSHFSLPLPDEEMKAFEERRFVVDLLPSEEIRLISPMQRVRDRVTFPKVSKSEIYKRTESLFLRDLRPPFEIQKRAEISEIKTAEVKSEEEE